MDTDAIHSSRRIKKGEKVEEPMKQILICKENRKNIEMLDTLLWEEGFEVLKTDNPEEIAEMLEQRDITLLVTDIKIAGRDCMQLIRDIRKNSGIPILVFSEEGSEGKKIAALNAGADDYVTLPCSPLELEARIKSQVYRYTQLVSFCKSISGVYRVDDLEINDVKRVVSVGGREVYLTPIEYKILRLLVKESGKVLSIGQIYEAIWNMQPVGVENTIAVHIRHIREKIESNPKEPRYLKVVWGNGYKVG